MIAIYVGVSYKETQAIIDDRKPKVTALLKWRNEAIEDRCNHPPTWEHLLEAIQKSCGYRVAEKLKEKVGKNPLWTQWPEETDPPQTHEAFDNSELRHRKFVLSYPV